MDSSKPYTPLAPSTSSPYIPPNGTTSSASLRPAAHMPAAARRPIVKQSHGSTLLVIGIIMLVAAPMTLLYQIIEHKLFRGNVAGIVPFVGIVGIGIGVWFLYLAIKKANNNALGKMLALGLTAGGITVFLLLAGTHHKSTASVANPLLSMVSILGILAGVGLIAYGVRLIAKR